jgi:hypothetical protein
MRESLSVMKARGLNFDHAWRAGFQKIKWPHDKQSRDEWKYALAETRWIWEDCYLDRGKPIDLESVLVHLANR